MEIKAAVVFVYKEDMETVRITLAIRVKIEEVAIIADEEERRIQILGQIAAIKVGKDEEDMAKVITKEGNKKLHQVLKRT